MRLGLERVPRRVRLVWWCAALLLVLGPLALDLARSTSFSASREAFTFPRRGYRPLGDRLAYIQGLLRDPLLPAEAARLSAFPITPGGVLPRVTVARTPQSVLVTARGDSPDHARELADATALALTIASSRDVGAQARARLTAATSQLAAAGPKRAQLQRSAKTLRSTVFAPPSELVLGPPASAPHPTRLADRILARLPGPLPPRPSPAWTVLAGLALATLVAAAYAYALPRRDAVTS